jgi:8-oxo-dGTP diphosphatase
MTGTPSYCLGFAFDIPDPGRVGGVHINPQVALIQKIKPKWQAGHLNGIGGLIEDFDHGHGASRAGLDAMVREFREETGFETQAENWQYFHTMGSEEWQVECYKAFGVPIHELKSTTDEEVTLVHALALPDTVLWNLRWLIPLALDHQPLPTMQVYR